ncbi:MBL fold metallo-hydrolase [Telluribacter sp.]|jgi:L-ascorbate metabolism protein UlaG (beta-lactamase superfamily)|uniref:MBL fold metallo-hydrolase n=1 Tax=Telluribacter sp. TaxID=1978767 RepID=UPI002E155570|nr:MBL fold metallo-hydrolase [Telluribacter sp.]
MKKVPGCCIRVHTTNFLFMVIAFFIVLVVIIFFVAFYEKLDWEQAGVHLNEKLKTIKPGWAGTPINKQGRFLNEDGEPVPGFSDLWRWQTQKNPQKEEKKRDQFRLPVRDNDHFLHSDKDCVVWLGHASFFIRLNGVTLLTDPVLTSPSRLMKRHSRLPLDPTKIIGLDYILVSHDHRDHCDQDSLQMLARQNPGATYLTGLGLGKLLTKWLPGARVQAAGWYQQYQTEPGKIEIIYLPAHHWGRRYFNDTNLRLWGSYLIRSGNKSIYFGADSGYASHYTDFRQLFGGVDIALLGVGAYKPEWFMRASHMGPADAVRAAHEINAERFIPMHYGTFDLSDEPLGDPYRRLQELKKEPPNEKLIHLAAVGEVVNL